jgi:trans-2,3-dihydro-3-hydroxyanthranilate isomerase
MELNYEVVDVFTERALEGNPLAVFTDARGLSDTLMQRIARELNLSETTFVLPATIPDAAAKVRIFTPGSEMLFAGHPTIGTAYVARERGIVPRDVATFVLEEKVGPVKVRVDDAGMIWLETPPITKGATFDRALCARVLSLPANDLIDDVPCQFLTAGNPTIFIPLKNAVAVDRVKIDSAALRQLTADLEPTCIFAFAPAPDGAYSRMFAEELGVTEDPATGSATGPLAAFMMEHGLVATSDGTRFISEQGTKMGRRSLLHVLVRGEKGSTAIEVGGHVAPVATATMRLPD